MKNLLSSQFLKIYSEIKEEKKVEVFGNLDFEIVDKIDNKEQRIAKLKGNKILVKQNAVVLPKSTLRYVIAHEIAHALTKRHTKKFLKTVELICPDFKRAQKSLERYTSFITGKLVREDVELMH